MKVYPEPMPRKRNITFQYNVNRSLAMVGGLAGRKKKLRRLPHIFSKVLELPLGSDADVDIQENPSEFVFVVAAEDVRSDVRAHAIHIHPGVTKVVIRDGRDDDEIGADLVMDDLELDRWRFRLPSCTRPELAVANYAEGELVVTIPKGGVLEESDDGDGDDEQVYGGGGMGGIDEGGIGRLVFVQ